MAGSEKLRYASRILQSGGVLAYPTEGVFGLGCFPDNYAAVKRVLEIKRRNASMGLILIFSDTAQLAGWADLAGEDLTTSIAKPVTWLVPATDAVPVWIRGSHPSLAVRLTTHPVAQALCELSGSCLVSTSANLSGHAPARNEYVLRRQFGTLVDYVVPGRCGPALGASEIRDLVSGVIVRSA